MPITLSKNEVKTKKLKLAFIGVGWIGRNRMDAILKSNLADAAVIADSVSSILEESKKTLPESKYASSIDEALEEENIDGVVIATPSAMHAEQAIKALEKRIPVFCQKPLGRNFSETKEVVKKAEEKNLLLGVDLSYRATKAFRKLNEIIQSGEIGEIFAVDLIFHNAYGPDKSWFYDINLSGGGCVIDLGIHLVDLALFTLGFPAVKKVNSKIYSGGKLLTKNSNEVEDYCDANILLANNTSINLKCSWNLSAGCDAIIEASFRGTKGGVSFKNINGSFYDFQTELYHRTEKNILVSPPDDWMGRAAVEWAESLSKSPSFNSAAEEYIKVAEIIDEIYGRYS